MGEVSKELHFSDVLLLPRMSKMHSRMDVDVQCPLGERIFRLPIVPANMKTVINENLAEWLAAHGYFYIFHRFGVDTLAFAKKMFQKGYPISVSVGVNADSLAIVEQLQEFPPDYITIDIAHGHCEKMARAIKKIKLFLPKTYLIAGNVCTKDGTIFLNQLGVDCVKVGIGSGKVCTTKLMTGFSRPQFSAVLDCAQWHHTIMSDGGIEHNGDIAKALVAGAKMVMTGHLLAGFDESPGKKIVYPDGRTVKEYFGSASEHNKGARDFIEGRRIEIPYRGPIEDKLNEIEQSLCSSVSYAGGKDLSAFRTGVDWVRQ